MDKVSGHDGLGNEFSSLSEVWAQGGDEWYGKALQYWGEQDASINGVLGGFGNLHGIDIEGSGQFLDSVPGTISVVGDCGAGIGRVAQFLLGKRFQHVDLIEPCAKLLAKAQSELPTAGFGYIQSPLQTWTPPVGHYDMLWHQWVLLYLTDEDCVAYLKRCKLGLKSGGFIAVKENVARDEFLVDPDDNSVTRTMPQYCALFAAAGLKIVTQLTQPKWPSHLFPVVMFALR